MKFRRMFGLVVALAAFAALLPGAASGTELRNSVEMLGAGTTVSAEAEGALALNGPFGGVECSGSSLGGKTSNTGGSTETVKVTVETLTFTGCSSTVTVLTKGTLEIHTREAGANGNGTLTSTSTEVTAEKAGVHCIYKTSSTTLGTLTGSNNTGKTATYDIAASLPRTGGKSGVFCGSTGEFKGSYKVTSPDTLNVDTGSVPTATSLSTSLSGESKSGEEITVNEGAKVKDTATLSGERASKATGTVKYKVYSDKECKELVTNAGEVTVTGGSVPASEEKSLEAGRVYYWQAEYSGDAENAASKSTCGKEVLTVKASTSISTSLSGEAKSGEEITVNEGSKVKDTATLSGTRSSSATGKVKFKAYKDKECKELASEAGEGSISEGKASSEEKSLEAGRVYYWQAEYAGDSLHQASTGTCGKEVLTVKAAVSLATALSGEEREGAEISVAGEAGVVDGVTLSGTRVTSATGTVTYKAYKDKECKELAAEAGEVEVKAGEAPASDEASLGEGVYYWRAEYSGDSLHQAASAACGSEILRVLGATSLTTTLSGESKEAAELEVIEGAAVSDSATLTGKNAAEATGTVKYSVYSDFQCQELVTSAGEVEVEGGEVPPSEAKILEPGLYFWQAEYSGDAGNLPSTGECGSEMEVVTPLITTSLTGGEASGEEIEVVEGTSVSDVATLHTHHAAEATGTVTYKVYKDKECKELVTKAGEVAVEGATAPASTKQTLPQGDYFWRAEYSGDELNPEATSACGSEQVVVTTPTTLTTSLSGGEEEGEEIEVEEGTAVSDQASLSGTNAATAIGVVSYAIYADSACTELVALAGESEVEAGSIGPSAAEALPVGTYYWQAEYSGDGVNHRSKSECGSEVEVVTAPITVALEGGGQSGGEIEVAEETAVTDDATLHGEHASEATETAVTDDATLHGEHASEATGTVTYKVYGDSACEELVATAGEVTVGGENVPTSSTETLKPGTYNWRAFYSGDLKNPPASTKCGSQVQIVRPAATTIYAAIGDSFSAGQGVGENGKGGTYYTPTATDLAKGKIAHRNICHRSNEAWPALVAKAYYGEGALEEKTVLKQEPPQFIFRACNGAKLANVQSTPALPDSGQYDEFINPKEKWLSKPSQVLWLSTPAGFLTEPVIPNYGIKLVTLTIGGNDGNFAVIAERCVQRPGGPTLAEFLSAVEAGEAAGISAIKAQLFNVLSYIHVAAPSARIRIPFYPNLLRAGTNKNIVVGSAFGLALLINDVDAGPRGLTPAEAIERFMKRLNRTIQTEVAAAAGPPSRLPVKVVGDTAEAFNGHLFGSAEPWANPVIRGQREEETFHPNRCGQKALARIVLKDLQVPAASWPASC